MLKILKGPLGKVGLGHNKSLQKINITPICAISTFMRILIHSMTTMRWQPKINAFSIL